MGRTRTRLKRPYRRDITKARRTQGCLTDCVAYILNWHPENVPFFVYPRAGWVGRLRRFFLKRGFFAYWIQCAAPPKRGTHIVCGDSLKYKTFCHVVVYRAGRVVYDPQYPSKWTSDRITHRLVLERL